MIELLLKALLSYLLGSVSGSLTVGAIKHVDIRKSGSGNAGGTNAFRTQGFWFALAVVVIDIGKGALAAWAIPKLSFPVPGTAVSGELLMLACGFAAVLGHCYPLWHGFRGGKGAATAVGALTVIAPAVILPMLLVWLLTLVISGWVGLSTMLAAIALVPAFIWLDAGPKAIAFAVLLAGFVVFTHRSNIASMINGSEYHFEKIMVRNWFRRHSAHD